MSLDAVLRDLDAAFATHVAELAEFVRIPSVAAEPERDEDTRRAADWLVRRLERAGLENVGLVETPRHPAVVAHWLHAPNAPTVLMYGHYDVQPAHREDGWGRDPFSGDVVDGRLHGRGAADDKGQLLCHVLAAEAWIRHGGPPVNLRMVFEGEEEVGSPHFPQVIERARDRLQADVLLCSDSTMHGEGRPAIAYALRGLSYLEVEVQGPRGDLHSGAWGGVLRNPLEALAHVISSCKDPETGRVLIDGFYDDVREASQEERDALPQVPDADITAGAGVEAVFGEAHRSNAERIGLRPTFEVHGLAGGYTGPGSKTLIPSKALGKLSCRLVADQDPERVAALVRRHIEAHAPTGVRVEVRRLNAGHPVRAERDHPHMKAVAKALEDAFGHPAVFVPQGITIPAIADLQRGLGLMPVLPGFANWDENMHGPDEAFRLASYETGRKACARMLFELANE